MDVTITSTPSAIRDESSSPDTVTNRKRRSIWKTDYALYEHRNTFMKVQRARKLHRTDIKPEDWDQEGYALTDICERLHVLNPGSSRIDIIDAKSYSPKNFLKSYVAEERPCIIKGAIAHWPAIRDRRWTMEELCKRFKHVPFKVGSDDYGRKIRMEFKYFADYCRNNHDDSPLYLFESGMMCRGEMTSLLDDYEVPREWFPEDIFALAGRDNRPPYRWFSVGPARSGTTVHKDPLGTHAWNALVTGTKRWVLLPPKIPEGIAKGRHVRDKDMDDEAVQYFDYMIPRIIAGMDSCEGEVYEAIQEPGDVIFVPGNWWHGVVNLNTTVAVTQNFVCSENFEEVWMRTRKERPKLSQRWRENIFRWAPELARRVAYIDENLDGLWRESLRKYAPGGDDTDSSSSSSSSSSSYSSSDTEGDIEWDEVEMKHSVGQRRPADTMTAVSPVEDVCMEHTWSPTLATDTSASSGRHQREASEGQKVRSSAFASMSKEVNQARLGMLGELMENRKRAEESEQFFLTRMQQEATSFQQLVQMFEDSLQKVTADIDNRLAGFISAEEAERLIAESNRSLDEKISGLEKKFDMKTHETSARLACAEASISELQKQVSQLKEEKEEELNTLNCRISDISTSYKAEISTSQSAVNSRISAMEDKMQSSLCNIEDEMKQGFSTVNSERLDAMDGSLSGLSSRLDAFDSKIDAVDNCIISIQAKHEKDREAGLGQHEQIEMARKALEDDIKGKLADIEQKISELKENVAMKTESETAVQKCEEMVAAKISTLSSELDSRFETIGKQMVDFQKTCDDQMEEFAAEHEHLKEELGKVHEVAKAASVDGNEKSAKLELKLQHDIKDITKQIEVVQPRIDVIQRDIQAKLGVLSRKLRHLSHSGLNHTWKLTDAVNKIGALGVSAGRFLDSPPFALGAYKNMQLRLFPKGCGHGPPGAASNLVMQKSAPCSLWLVWNPQGSNRDSRLPPIRVELAVGKSRKGPLEMGHHESLYGCYVWQGNDICVLEHELLPDGSLEVSVSIPYRQWYDALELTPDEADFEKEQLGSEIAQNVFHPKPEASDDREALGSSRMSIASSAFTFAPDMPGVSSSISAPSPPMARIPESSNPFDRTLPSLAELQPRAPIRPSSAAQLRSFSPTPAFSDGEATMSNRGDRVRPQTMNLGATRNPFSTSGSDLDVPTAPNSPSATARQTQPMHRQRNSVPASFSHPVGPRGSETVSPRRSNWTQFAGCVI